jgi:hypothetical protein
MAPSAKRNIYRTNLPCSVVMVMAEAMECYDAEARSTKTLVSIKKTPPFLFSSVPLKGSVPFFVLKIGEIMLINQNSNGTSNAASIKATSLKLPAELKTQLQNVANTAGLSLHAYMVQTLADSVRRAILREAFSLDSMTALRDMKASDSGCELGEVRTYFSVLAKHRKGMQERPQEILPTPLA